MFPREIQSESPLLEDGRKQLYRIGKLSLRFTLFSLTFFFVRIILLIFLVTEMLKSNSFESVFDIFGNVFWGLTDFLCELMTVTSIISNHKKLTRYFNKILFLNDFYGIEEKDSTQSVRKFGICLMLAFLSSIFTSFGILGLTFLQTASGSYVFFTFFIFVYFCCSSCHNLAVLQARVHNLDDSAINILSSKHFSSQNKLLNKGFCKQFLKSVTGYSLPTESNGSHLRLSVHLRMQKMVDSLTDELMRAIAIGIVIYMAKCIISMTFGSYFIIKSVSSRSITFLHDTCFTMSSCFACYQFVNMSNNLSNEVSVFGFLKIISVIYNFTDCNAMFMIGI